MSAVYEHWFLTHTFIAAAGFWITVVVFAVKKETR